MTKKVSINKIHPCYGLPNVDTKGEIGRGIWRGKWTIWTSPKKPDHPILYGNFACEEGCNLGEMDEGSTCIARTAI